MNARYSYTLADGSPLYEVVRHPGKRFVHQRYDRTHPQADERGYWAGPGCMDGVTRVPFRLPQVQRAVREGTTVFVVEGEKDVLAIEEAGGTATCNSGGAGRWTQSHAEYLRGATCVVVQDRDTPGRHHGAIVVASLQAVGADVTVVEARSGKDAADNIAAGHGLDFRRAEVVEQTPRRENQPRARKTADVQGDGTRYGLRTLDYLVDEIMACGVGAPNEEGLGRNNALNRAAFRAGQLVADGSLDQTTTHEALLAAADRVGLPFGEAKSTVGAAMEKGMGSGWRRCEELTRLPRLSGPRLGV